MATLSPNALQSLSLLRIKLVEDAETAKLVVRNAAHKAKVAKAAAEKAKR
jgi:hypothetical protein